MEGELFVESLVGVLGSYTVAGSSMGGSEGRRGGGPAVTAPCVGERARRGLAVGERWEKLFAVLPREGEEWTREGEAGSCAAGPA